MLLQDAVSSYTLLMEQDMKYILIPLRLREEKVGILMKRDLQIYTSVLKRTTLIQIKRGIRWNS